MRVPHLHALGRYTPLRGVEVNLGPLGGTQLTRSKENKRREFQSVMGRGLANILVNRPQELADPLRLGDCGAVLNLQRG